ncbi:canalicular multispecific organic anion transporter 1 [Podospora australis]|uniref:Canalicular multispecific organic anion transporter 1 n=1 Tax=Podospora australis TaxID=1536484 RepID=A0AAN6WPQ1_9PEZI|nr:canalicular multispecific organic anion transporter 1 [Podospora australis]
MMDFSGCVNDESLGPTVVGCRDDFDFTIKFERIFFSLIPTSLFLALSLSRLVHLIRKPIIVGGTLLRLVKLATITVYSAVQLVLLVLSTTRSGRFGALFIPSDAIALGSALCMITLSSWEHSRSPRPSIFLNGYLFISILLDVSQTRTLWLASTNATEHAYARIFTSGVALKALLIVLESQSKTRWMLLWDTKIHSPEETSGLYGLGAYFWLNRLFLKGYRSILKLDDLYPLDATMASETLYNQHSQQMDVAIFRGQKHGLCRSLAKTLAVQLLLPVGPRIAMGAFQFCQPFLIETLLKYLSTPSETTPKNLGCGLIGATLLIYVGIAVSAAFYWYFQERAMYMARGLLAATVYRKTTESKLSAADDSAALTLMSADVERIIVGCLPIHEFWANAVEVALACWLLSRQIGVAFLAPLIVVGCCIVCSYFTAKLTGPRQKAWMEKIQKRVGLTSSILGQMKHLKISGLAVPVEEAIQGLRIDELNAGARFRTVLVYSSAVAYTPLCLSPVITFAFASRTLDVTTMFTSISYILLLASPLGSLLQHVTSLLSALACLGRIQSFLETDPRVDFRDSGSSLYHTGEHVDRTTDPGPSNTRTANAADAVSDSSAIAITSGSFAWQSDKPTLSGLNVSIPKSRLTVIVGPVASGKSTFCNVILGEVPVFEGRVLTGDNVSRTIGYCAQTPYLSNSTIRENIVGYSQFHQERYEEILEATMLEEDLALLPNGDGTNIGSSGISLSGGQKQRVSMARALYLNTDLFVFDDILSGLDADTEEQVFRRVFSSNGLIRRRNATAVLCTHSVRHLPAADHIIALGTDGSIVEQGSFQELMTNDKYVSTLGVVLLSGDSSSDTPSSSGTDRPKPAPPKPPVVSETTDSGRITGDFAVYRHYFARLNLISIVAFATCGVGWGFFSNFATIWLKFWSEDVGSPNPKHSNAYYNGLYALFQVGSLLCLFFLALAVFTSTIKFTGAKLHNETLRTVINAPLKFFATTDTGVITNLFSQDMTILDGQLPMSLVNLVLYLFNVLGMAAVILTSSPYLAITYPFLAAILYILQKFYLRTSRQIRLLDLEAKSPLYSHFIDTIKGIATMRAHSWVSHGVKKNDQLLDTSQRPAYLLAMIQRWLEFTLHFIVAVLAIAVVTLATQLRSNTAFAGASLVTLMAFGEALSYIIRFYTMLETSIGAVSRLKTFSETVKSENEEGEDVVPPKEWPLKGAIQITGVSASYDGEENDNNNTPAAQNQFPHLVLKDLNLDIAPGEKLTICGRSGSGKSSLILLLLRLLDPVTPQNNETETEITIDSLPLSKIQRSVLRQRLIAVPQDPVFLPDGTSFQSNLDPFHLASEADCRSVLEAVALWPLVSERGGLQAGMSGDALSQGQRQLFSLARAILRRRIRAREREAEYGSDVPSASLDGGVLLLDEVSSSVDKNTDEAMQAVIRQEFAGYTIVMVSHRLGMVMEFDRVVVMDEGRIVEVGKPKSLVETEGSRFRDLWLVGKTGK